MQISLKKFGNSRALVIPKAILELFRVKDDAVFIVESKNDELVVRLKGERAKKIESARKTILEKHGNVYASLANK